MKLSTIASSLASGVARGCALLVGGADDPSRASGWVRVTQRVLIAAVILFGAALAGLMVLPRLPATPAEAVITGIFAEPHGEGFPPTVAIVARASDGRTGRMSVPTSQIRCKIGDTIRAESIGVTLRLKQSDCASLGSYD